MTRSAIVVVFLASGLALLAAVGPSASARASERPGAGRDSPVLPAPKAAGTRGVDGTDLEGQAIVGAVRQDVERLISAYTKLQARVHSLGADLERERSRVQRLASERDQARLEARDSAARSAKLEARLKSAQDALAVERGRLRELRQEMKQGLGSLRSERSVAGNARDDLRAPFGEKVGSSPGPVGSLTGLAAEPKASDRDVGGQEPQQPQGHLARIDGARHPLTADLVPRPKTENSVEEEIRGFLSRHQATLQEARGTLTSTALGTDKLRSRLIDVEAALEGLHIDRTAAQDASVKVNSSLEDLAARLEEGKTGLDERGSRLRALSIESEALSSAVAGIQSKVREVTDQKNRVRSETDAFGQIKWELAQRFDRVAKRTLELETAAELMDIRQALADFKSRRIGRAALAQHEAVLEATAAQLALVSKDLARATRDRERLLVRADSLGGQVALLEANLNDVAEDVRDQIKRVDAWLNGAGALLIPPAQDVASMLGQVEQAAALHRAAAAQTLARVQKQLERHGALQIEVGAISAVLEGLGQSLNRHVDRLSRVADVAAGTWQLPQGGGRASDRVRPCGGLARAQDGDGTSLPGSRPCTEIDRFLEAVVGVRQALEVRLGEVGELLRAADRLRADLAGRGTVLARAQAEAVAAVRASEAELGRGELLGSEFGALAERQRVLEDELSARSDRVSGLSEQLKSLAGGLSEAATDVQAYASVPSVASTAKHVAREGIHTRLKDVSDRVDVLRAAVASLKRPPPLPAKAVSRAMIEGPGPGGEQRGASKSAKASGLDDKCSPGLASCRRWLFLQGQRAQGRAADDRGN